MVQETHVSKKRSKKLCGFKKKVRLLLNLRPRRSVGSCCNVGYEMRLHSPCGRPCIRFTHASRWATHKIDLAVLHLSPSDFFLQQNGNQPKSLLLLQGLGRNVACLQK